MGVAPAHARGQPRIAPLDRAQEHREAALRQVAAGELCARGPGGRAHAEGRSETVHRVLGQAAVGGDLAPEHRQQGRGLLLELQGVVARDPHRVARFIGEQRPHARVAPHDIGRRELLPEVAVGERAQVGHFPGVDGYRRRIGAVIHIRGAEQSEVVLVGDREHDAPVLVLEDVGEAMSEQPRYHDVAALHEAHLARGAHRGGLGEEPAHPGAGGVHHRARLDDAQLAAAAERCAPEGAARRQPLTAGVGEDGGAARARIECVQHHESRIVGLSVGVQEAAPIARLERLAGDVRAQVDGGGAGQARARGQVIVEQQPGADHPRRAQVRGVRHDELQRPHDVRRGTEQHLALLQRLAHQREVELLQITQATVDELGAGRGGV